MVEPRMGREKGYFVNGGTDAFGGSPRLRGDGAWTGGDLGFPRCNPSAAGDAFGVKGRCRLSQCRGCGSGVHGFRDEEYLDISMVYSWLFSCADGEGCDVAGCGFAENCSARCGAVDVVVLDGDGHLGEDVVSGVVHGEYQVCPDEFVGLLGGDKALGLCLVEQHDQGQSVLFG